MILINNNLLFYIDKTTKVSFTLTQTRTIIKIKFLFDLFASSANRKNLPGKG